MQANAANSQTLSMNPSFPPSLQGSISKPQVGQAVPVTFGGPAGFFMFQPTSGGGGGLPEFGSAAERGSFPYFMGMQGVGSNAHLMNGKSGSFERSPNSSFVRYGGGNK